MSIIVTKSFDEFIDYLSLIGALEETKVISLPNYRFPFVPPKLLGSSGYGQLSSRQQSYFSSLKSPLTFRAAKGNFLQISFKLTEYDSKDFFLSPDGKMLYDNQPWWAEGYLKSLIKIVGEPQLFLKTQNIVSTGGVLSFSHFCGRNLLALTMLDSLDIREDCYLPFKSQWQVRLARLFGMQNSFVETPSAQNINFCDIIDKPYLSLACSSSWLFQEVDDWFSLLALRSFYLRLQTSTFRDKSTLPSHPSSSVYLSRYRYEVLRSRDPRVANSHEIFTFLKDNSFKPVFPEITEISALSTSISIASEIVSDPGSCFVNYLLFSSKEARIFQFLPAIALEESSSFWRASNMQWFYPCIDQIRFLPSQTNLLSGASAASLDLLPDVPYYYNISTILNAIN